MSDLERRLRQAARRCFGLSLAGLVAIAALANLAFYLSLFDRWALIRPIGPVVVFGAAFFGFTFVLGFLIHVVGVLAHQRLAAEETPAERRQTADVRPRELPPS